VGLAPALHIDGVVASGVTRPASIEELCSTLREANAMRLRVTPVGGGTHSDVGYPVDRIDLAVDMTALSAVNEYEPDDLTISVQAGMRVAALASLLEARGQHLPLDVEQPERATIGGAIAVGHAGPRRYGFGSLRDLLIGLRVVLADGTLVKSGGMVVKNVSGYDLTKLHHGALGSLGLIVDANFKLLSAPKQRTLLIAEYRSPSIALEAAASLVQGALPYSAVAVTGPGKVHVGCEGHIKDAARLRAEALKVLQAAGAAEVQELHGTADSASHWGSIGPAARGEAEVVFRVNAPIAAMAGLTRQALELGVEHDLVMSWTADMGCGVLELGAGPKVGIPRLNRFYEALAQIAELVRVSHGAPDVRRELPVFGPEPQGLALMRLIKNQFDPNGILNVGKNVGRL